MMIKRYIRDRMAQVVRGGEINIYADTDTLHCENCQATTVDVVAGVPLLRIYDRWGPLGIDYTAWCLDCWAARTQAWHTWIHWLPDHVQQGTWLDIDNALAMLTEVPSECAFCRNWRGPVEGVVHAIGATDVDLVCRACLDDQTGAVGRYDWWAEIGPVYTLDDETRVMDRVRAGTIDRHPLPEAAA
jgi:hypothetical protein